MPAAEPLSHVVLDELGVARIDETTVKVIDIALDHLAYGWSADAIHEQFPHLSLGQIHAALGYFYDHQAQFEMEIGKLAHEISQYKDTIGDSPLQRRLRQLKLGKNLPH